DTVTREFREAHPDVPPILIADLSRPEGGPFGPRYGGLGHDSHQNGLDADVMYPRRDRAPLPALRPAEVDRALAQDLVDRFRAAPAGSSSRSCTTTITCTCGSPTRGAPRPMRRDLSETTRQWRAASGRR